MKELIDRWLTSLDLHLQYVDLNDSAYNKVQPWPVHDRPTRWVLEHAKQKALELRAAFESRLAMGDAKFAESVELIVFLANLVGLQHVQRFVPLADPERHGQATLTELDGLKPVRSTPVAASGNTTIEATVAMPPRPTPPPASKPAAPPPKPAAPPPSIAKPPQSKVEDDATREMPRPVRAPPAPAAPSPQAKPAAKKPASPASAPQPSKGGPLTEIQKMVIDDAVRLLNWGRPWHELAEAIARIADRPKAAEVRKILRSHRAAIEMRAANSEEAAEKEK